MGAIKIGGSSGGSMASAVRGASGSAFRSGGIESRGGSSSGRSFGNTAKFEKSFSGRSFATIARNSALKSPESGNNPSIFKTPANRSENTYPKVSLGTRKEAGKTRSFKSFGPKIEATKGFSVDTYRPGISAFKNTKPIVRTEAGNPTPKNPESRIHHTTKKFQVSENSFSEDTAKPKSLIKDTKLIYRNGPDKKIHSEPEQVKIHTEPVAPRKSITHKSDHPLYKDTVEYQVQGRLQSDKRIPEHRRSLYERMQQGNKKSRETVTVYGRNENNTLNATVTNPQQTAPETGKRVKVSPISESRMKRLNELRAIDTRWERPLNSLIREHTSINKPEKSVNRALRKTNTPQSVSNVSPAEVQNMLSKYREQFLTHAKAVSASDLSDTTETGHDRINATLLQHPEVKSDIEQAVRVMAAYKAVIGSNSSVISETSAEQTVLRVLDSKFSKTGVKTTLKAEPHVRYDRLPSNDYYSESVKSNRSEIEQPVGKSNLATQDIAEIPLIRQPAVEYQNQIQPAKTVDNPFNRANPVMSLELYNRLDSPAPKTMLQTAPSNGSGNVKNRVSTGRENTREPETKEMKNENEQLLTPEEEQELLELLLAYERDEALDQLRQDLAYRTAQIIMEHGMNKPIDGHIIAQTLYENYLPLRSDIIPHGKPDDYLTDIIEHVSGKEYETSYHVFEDMNKLTQIFPAVTLGTRANIPQREAHQLRKSFRWPKTWGHRLLNPQ